MLFSIVIPTISFINHKAKKMKSKEEILTEYGCPEIPFDENVKMFYPAILSAMEEYANQCLLHFKLPSSDAQIRAYALLQLIAKAEVAQESPYAPENEIRNANIANWKKEYYQLIGKAQQIH